MLQLIQVWKGWYFWLLFPCQIVCFNPYQLAGPFWPDTLRQNSLLQQHLQGSFLQATKMTHGIAQMSHILQSEISSLLNINLQGKRSSSSVSYCAACSQGKQWGKRHNIKDFLKILYDRLTSQKPGHKKPCSTQQSKQTIPLSFEISGKLPELIFQTDRIILILWRYVPL